MSTLEDKILKQVHADAFSSIQYFNRSSFQLIPHRMFQANGAPWMISAIYAMKLTVETRVTQLKTTTSPVSVTSQDHMRAILLISTCYFIGPEEAKEEQRRTETDRLLNHSLIDDSVKIGILGERARGKQTGIKVQLQFY